MFTGGSGRFGESSGELDRGGGRDGDTQGRQSKRGRAKTFNSACDSFNGT